MTKHREDSQIGRFDEQGVRSYGAWDGVKAVLIAALLLVLLSGGSVRDAAAELDPGVGRSVIEAVGEPTGWLADRFPFAAAQQAVTGGLSPDVELGEGGFEATAAATATAGRIPPVTPDAFDPTALGVEPQPNGTLETMLVTGDSMSQPLDSELARRLAPEGVEVVRDVHLGSGISRTEIVDWGQLSVAQVEEHSPDAIVVFIGAGDGYPMEGPDGRTVACCGPEWAAIYANRARQMMDTYRRSGDARVYWITVPTPRDDARSEITRVVNAAVGVAAQPWLSQVRVIDTVPVFAPGDRYRDAIEIDGEETIVRESDGLHLSPAGAGLLADLVLERIETDFAP